MKIILTSAQLLRLLSNGHKPKFPIIVKLKGFTEKEMQTLFKEIELKNKKQ